MSIIFYCLLAIIAAGVILGVGWLIISGLLYAIRRGRRTKKK